MADAGRKDCGRGLQTLLVVLETGMVAWGPCSLFYELKKIICALIRYLYLLMLHGFCQLKKIANKKCSRLLGQ